MKIALVSPYDVAVPGGVNAHMAHLAREFREGGHEVRIVAAGSNHGDLPPDTIAIGRALPIPSGGSLARVTLSPGLGADVKELLAAERFDVVHVHEPLVPILPIQFLRFAGPVRVGTFHAAHDNGSLLYWYTRPLLRRWFRHLDGKIAVSSAAVRLIGRYFPGYYNIIPNGIDVETFARPAPRPAAVADGRPYILFVGRFERRKGLRYLLRAYATLKPSYPALRLVVVGDGRRRERYQSWVADHGLDDVIFTGYVSDEERNGYYQHATVFCAPNTGNESFGIVLLEAMAAGRPIVATAIEGFEQVVSDGAEGLLVPPRDAPALAVALSRILSDHDLAAALAARGRQRVAQYAWPRVAGRVLSYYQRLLTAYGLAVG